MPTTQKPSTYEQQVIVTSTRYVATLLAKLTGVDREAVNKAIISDTSDILQSLSLKGTRGDIPKELVGQAMEQQASDRLSKWGLDT